MPDRYMVWVLQVMQIESLMILLKLEWNRVLALIGNRGMVMFTVPRLPN